MLLWSAPCPLVKHCFTHPSRLSCLGVSWPPPPPQPAVGVRKPAEAAAPPGKGAAILREVSFEMSWQPKRILVTVRLAAVPGRGTAPSLALTCPRVPSCRSGGQDRHCQRTARPDAGEEDRDPSRGRDERHRRHWWRGWCKEGRWRGRRCQRGPVLQEQFGPDGPAVGAGEGQQAGAQAVGG